MIEIQWTDTDPESAQRRYWSAVRFAQQWRFRMRTHRRGDWVDIDQPTRATWEAVLDALRRRYQRREKVSEELVRQVERHLRNWRDPPSVDVATPRSLTPPENKAGESPTQAS